jgi:hypothetical protein
MCWVNYLQHETYRSYAEAHPQSPYASNTDASLATGPRRRSILGSMIAFGLDSGAVHAKATTSESTCLSSFEAELDGLTTILKSVIHPHSPYIAGVIT